MLMVAACSTAASPTPIGVLPAYLLAAPLDFRVLIRNADGGLDGKQRLSGRVETLDVGGTIRVQLLGVIAAERQPQAAMAARLRQRRQG